MGVRLPPLAPLEASMKVAVEEMESCKRRLVVEAPADVVTKEWERAYDRVQKQARLPGFRKGHVPRSLVKLHFADDVRREVAEHLIPDVYRQALSEARLDPVNEPDLQEVKLEENAPLSFVAVVEVKPAIALGDYKGVDVQHAPTAVTDDEVAATLEQMREQQAEFRAVDRPATSGDLVVVDYTLRPDDHDATTANGYHFVIGSGAVMAEIDAAAVGMKAGAEKEVPLRFPDDHRVESLRGKGGSAGLKVSEVKEKIVPAVMQRHEFTVPDTMVMRQIAHQVEQARERLRRQGVNPDGVQWDVPKLVGELRPGAEQGVRRALLLEAIADKEGLAPGDDEVEAEVEKIARASQRPAPAVRRMMEKSGDLEALRMGLRERKTLDFLIGHATIHGDVRGDKGER